MLCWLFYRHIFLFDVAAIICKRRGDNYEMKDTLDLNVFKVTDNPTSDREGKKVSPVWIHVVDGSGFRWCLGRFLCRWNCAGWSDKHVFSSAESSFHVCAQVSDLWMQSHSDHTLHRRTQIWIWNAQTVTDSDGEPPSAHTHNHSHCRTHMLLSADDCVQPSEAAFICMSFSAKWDFSVDVTLPSTFTVISDFTPSFKTLAGVKPSTAATDTTQQEQMRVEKDGKSFLNVPPVKVWMRLLSFTCTFSS